MDKHAISIAEINATLDRIIRDREKEAQERKKELDTLRANMAAQIEKISRDIAELRAETRGISESNGMFTEAYFHNTMQNSMCFGGIMFDIIDQSFSRSKKMPDGTKIKDEYDIVLYNAETIALIEIKYRAYKDDTMDLINRKLRVFKQLFPKYANHKFLLGLGGLSFEDGVEDDAINHGIGILKTKGESIEII
ncbi:MAG: hypothetical protein FWG98_04745, partial [Candidatus Cloacimonetes bacterium]|nr:hypothetical protein [Candidatus Cloacimonadota bacterium]